MYFDTLTVQGKREKEYEGAVSVPIFQTSTYRNPGLESNPVYSYTRCSNPTRKALEDTIALLEGGNYGFAFSSGLAAINVIFSLFTAGDEVIISDDLYGGTYRLIDEIYSGFGIVFKFTDTTNLEEVKKAYTLKTKMIFTETPTNPMMKVADISAISAFSKEKGLIFAVDNTFLTPYFQKPLALGADIVIHSATKFLSGHHDTIAGLIVTNNSILADRISLLSRTHGSALSPFDCWLVLRGMQTLALRMERHQENSLAVATFLQNHNAVESVYYVGLPSHSDYETTKKQSSGFGGTISFTVKKGIDVGTLLTSGTIIRFAESLGGISTLITYPLTQTHASIPQKMREKIGITPRLLRLAVGIEDKRDIIADLNKMLLC